MDEVTMLEFRSQSARVLARLGRGERLLLTHRGKPGATLEPVLASDVEISDDDPIRRLEEFAFDGPGGDLDSSQIDRLVYGE